MCSDVRETPLELELPAVPESVPQARHAVVAYSRPCEADLDAIAIATSEAVTNVVKHAYRHRIRRGVVRLRAKLKGSDLLVSVSDDGVGMFPDPNTKSAGIGLPLIGAFASEVKLDTSHGGVRIEMRFPCPHAG